MAKGQFLVRNRHNNSWYGRVVIPASLRAHFNGKREIRRSLKTTDKTLAKQLSLEFWLTCQRQFDQIKQNKAHAILDQKSDMPMFTFDEFQNYTKTTDLFGREHIFDFSNPAQEMEMARYVQDNAYRLFEQCKDRPDILEYLRHLNQAAPEVGVAVVAPPQTPKSFSEAVDLYINRLKTQGRKGRKLKQRTLESYIGRLHFWKDYFNDTAMHEITLHQLSQTQELLTSLPANFSKKGLSVEQALEAAKTAKVDDIKTISDKTRSEYLGQLKALLEYAKTNGFTHSDLSVHIEMPNTKRSKAVLRLPYTTEDLQKIFPGQNYGVDFGRNRAGLDRKCKFWFPLLAVFTGARLEEIAQLGTNDIQIDQETQILFANITDRGMAADGKKKQVKTASSVRPIPIHNTLIDIGFVEYWNSRSKSGKKSLFDLKRDAQGRLAKGMTNWFTRNEKRKDGRIIQGYIERRGITSKGINEMGENWSKSFHSFRHTVIDNLRGKEMANGEFIHDQYIGLIAGHSLGNLETVDYGIDHSQLKLRKAIIDTIHYKDVDFDQIKWQE